MNNVFHLAIATHNLDEAEEFYTTVLGAKVSRRYDDRVTFNFFNHQLVCHLSPDRKPDLSSDPFKYVYPDHFGMTFTEEELFDSTYRQCVQSGWKYIQKVKFRFPNLPEKHKTFFMADPTHNIVEFKYYYVSKFIY